MIANMRHHSPSDQAIYDCEETEKNFKNEPACDILTSIANAKQDFSKECVTENNFLISHQNHMLCVLKRTVSIRRFF